jgi:DNA-binding beta-propeller fold protein YncE
MCLSANARRQLLTVDKVGCALLFVDPDGEVRSRLPMPRGPHEIVLSPDNAHAFVSIYGTGTFRANPHPGFEIERVCLANGTPAGTFTVTPWTSPHGLTFDGDGVLWTSCDRHGVVLAISVQEGKVVGAVETGSYGTHWVLATPDGRKLFTSNKQDAFVGVIDPVARRLTRRIAVPHGTEGLAVSPDGRWLFAADHRMPAVLRIDVEREEVVETIVLRGVQADLSREAHHMRLRVSPDGITLCVAAYHYDRLFLIETADPKQQRVVPTGKGPMAMAFDPAAANRLYLSNHDDGTIGVINVAEARTLRTFPCGEGVESMAFVARD